MYIYIYGKFYFVLGSQATCPTSRGKSSDTYGGITSRRVSCDKSVPDPAVTPPVPTESTINVTTTTVHYPLSTLRSQPGWPEGGGRRAKRAGGGRGHRQSKAQKAARKERRQGQE